MAQWVNMLVALLESLGLVLSAPIRRFTTATLNFQEASTLICPLQAPHPHHALVLHLDTKAVVYHVRICAMACFFHSLAISDVGFDIRLHIIIMHVFSLSCARFPIL